MSNKSFMEKTKDFFGMSDPNAYDGDYYNDRFEEREPEPRYRSRYEDEERPARPSRTHSPYSSAPASSYGASREAEPSRAGLNVHKEPSVVNLVIQSYHQAPGISDALREGDVVVFNLRGMQKSEATRVLDFAAGVGKALEAGLKKLQGHMNFVLIPKGTELDQSQLDQLGGE